MGSQVCDVLTLKTKNEFQVFRIFFTEDFLEIIKINFPVSVESKKIFSLKIMLRDFFLKRFLSLKDTIERLL